MNETEIEELKNKVDFLLEYLEIDYDFEKRWVRSKHISKYRNGIDKNTIIPERIEKGGIRESERFE